MALFDVYVAVDWSAAKVPGRGMGTIWIAVLPRDGSATVENPPTRTAATERVHEILCAAAEAGDRVLVGFDFAYGYPHGFADAVAPGPGPPWRRVWDELGRLVADSDDNDNNRHAVAVELNSRLRGAAFWGSGDPRLSPTRPTARPLPDLRIVESDLRRRDAYPKSVWQLSYSGSVGSQTLLGIPRVRSLRDNSRLAAVSAVWPFETGFAVSDETQIVHVEIYPTIAATPSPLHPVHDAHLVLSAVSLWQALDSSHSLGELFAAPANLDSSETAAVVREEGWILGASLRRGCDGRRRRQPGRAVVS